ncbi:helix-turn-helix domain-containing protein [Halodesulfovibrio aestuarii]|uniref:Helix-turn-helix domain-containing protein n=1 Tax=Halodesulfovibrio aestuarii TaxID=126333 RepID=A0ABV4JQY8_9BACT
MKKDNKLRMAKFDPENAYAWEIILDALRDLRAQGKTQKEIAQILGVNKDTVSRWLSENRGGERSTFGMMIRCAKALGIPLEKLVEDFKTPTIQPKITAFDQKVGEVLEEFTKDADLTITDIAEKANLSAVEVNAVFAGTTPATPTILNNICEAVEVGATMVLKRATKSLKREREKDTTAVAERSA